MIVQMHHDFENEYFKTIAALLVTLIGLSIPQPVSAAEFILTHMITALTPDEGASNWAKNEYLPQILKETSKVSLSMANAKLLGSRIAGAIIKLGWAFLWQEELVPVPHSYYTDLTLRLAVYFTPAVNSLASWVSGMP